MLVKYTSRLRGRKESNFCADRALKCVRILDFKSDDEDKHEESDDDEGSVQNFLIAV